MYREKWMVEVGEWGSGIFRVGERPDVDGRGPRVVFHLDEVLTAGWVFPGVGAVGSYEDAEDDLREALPPGTLIEWLAADESSLGWAKVLDPADIDGHVAWVYVVPPLKVRHVGLKEMTVLPPGPGVCQECARDHAPEEPHDAQSLHYQFVFRQREDRWPSWADAAAHCAPEVRLAWRGLLERDHGVVWDDPRRVGGR